MSTMDELQKYSKSASCGYGKSAMFAIFYQTTCPYCKKEQPVWNAAMNLIQKTFGNKAAFVKVDVRKSYPLSRSYGVSHTPYVVYLGVGANNVGFNLFSASERTV